MELEILNVIQQIRNPILDKIMVFLSALSNHGEIWIFFGIVLLIFEFWKKEKVNRYRNVRNVIGRNNELGIQRADINFGMVVLIALVLSFLLVNVIIKPSVARIRPYEINQSINLIVPMLKDYSFPSGHTSVSFAGAMAIFYYNRKLSIYAFVLAFMIAFSRLYLYVHYPSDVIAGAIIGVICAAASYYINLFIAKKYREI